MCKLRRAINSAVAERLEEVDTKNVSIDLYDIIDDILGDVEEVDIINDFEIVDGYLVIKLDKDYIEKEHNKAQKEADYNRNEMNRQYYNDLGL